MTKEQKMNEARASTTWEAPRWAKVESFVKDQAMLLGLTCKTEVEKGLIRERGRVEVRGGTEECREFIRRFHAAAREYSK